MPPTMPPTVPPTIPPTVPPEPVVAGSADDAARAARAAHRTRQILGAAARLMGRSGAAGVSMQAIADEAGVSVGLLYRYFAGKDELLLAVIVDVLGQYDERLPAALTAAGDDPVDRLHAGFATYCEVIDEHRHAAMLTYRESRSLGESGVATIKRLEVDSLAPLRAALRDGTTTGVFRPLDVDLVAYDLLVLAHAWALKHWYFERGRSLDEYVRAQFATVLAGLLRPERHATYLRYLDPSGDHPRTLR